MKSEKLLEAMNDLPEELIAEANTRRRHPLVRIAAVAACLVVLLVGMYPFLQSFQGLGTSDDCYVSDREVIYRQGAIYEVVGTNYTAAMERLALPETITEDLVGEKVDVAPDYGDVYQYAPLAGRNGTAPAALYLLERTDEGHEGEWWYLAFTGFVAGDESGYAEAETMFQVYGIQSPADIAAVRDRHSGEQLLSPEAFYDTLLAAPSFGWEDFHEQTSAVMNASAGAVGIRLETDWGLRTYMTYYPETGFVKWLESYYQVGKLL